MPTPAYRLTLKTGKDITTTLAQRLITLTLTEARNNEADQLDITLDDSDGQLALPSKGQTLALAIGWQGQGLIDKGTYTVNEVEHTGQIGSADQITIRARSADLSSNLRTRQDASYHSTTLGAILTQIAARHSLAPRIDPTLAATAVAHIDQTGESDLAFVTRLAKRYDAVATIKLGRLLFLPISGTKTSKGKKLEPVQITRASGDQHRYHTSDRDHYSGVRAYYHDGKAAKRKGVLVGKSGNAKRLQESYATQAEAQAAAAAEWRRLQRGAATFELTLALGNPLLSPQTPVQVSGFKPDINAINWLTIRATHTIGDGGYTTRIELENAEADTSTGGTVHDLDVGQE